VSKSFRNRSGWALWLKHRPDRCASRPLRTSIFTLLYICCCRSRNFLRQSYNSNMKAAHGRHRRELLPASRPADIAAFTSVKPKRDRSQLGPCQGVGVHAGLPKWSKGMNRMRSFLVPGVIALAMAATVSAQSPQSAAAKPAFYGQTNLVTSAKSLKAKLHDQNLLNPWGLVQGPTPFWVSDNNAGVSTLYDGNGKIFTVAEVRCSSQEWAGS
jgi:hypothetical protein